MKYLSGEVDCTWLALGTDALRPGRVVHTPWLHLAVQVLQVGEFTSADEVCGVVNAYTEQWLNWSIQTDLSTPLVSFLV